MKAFSYFVIASGALALARSARWKGSKSESQETVNGRVYLDDVLCVRSGY